MTYVIMISKQSTGGTPMSQAAHLLDRTTIFRHDSEHLWNGCGTITTDGSTILTAWYTGGYKEPHPDNYVVFSRSFDKRFQKVRASTLYNILCCLRFHRHTVFVQFSDHR